jgi:hypothetical protein
MLACIWSLIAIGVYAYSKAPPAPQVAPEFIQIGHLNPANPLGDRDFVCQTQYCNDSDKYVGLQSHSRYQDRWHLLAGLAVPGKATLLSNWGTPVPHRQRRDLHLTYQTAHSAIEEKR